MYANFLRAKRKTAPTQCQQMLAFPKRFFPIDFSKHGKNWSVEQKIVFFPSL